MTDLQWYKGLIPLWTGNTHQLVNSLCQTCKAEIALLENLHTYVPFKQNPKRLT